MRQILIRALQCLILSAAWTVVTYGAWVITGLAQRNSCEGGPSTYCDHARLWNSIEFFGLILPSPFVLVAGLFYMRWWVVLLAFALPCVALALAI